MRYLFINRILSKHHRHLFLQIVGKVADKKNTTIEDRNAKTTQFNQSRTSFSTRALETSFFLAPVCKQSRRVFTIEVDVAEHSGCTIIAQVVQLISVRTCKFLECGATFLGWVFGTLALACYDCVVLKLKVHWTYCSIQKNKEKLCHLEAVA